MADALCGPSNPLQSFQKHATVDRTLHQDRIASRQKFEKGFRSSTGPNAGVLDAEFEAFKVGHLDSGWYNAQPVTPGPLQDHYAPGSISTAAPNWAADFQNIYFNEAQNLPVSQSQFRREAPIQHTAPGGLHQDFMRQHTSTSPNQSFQQPRYNASHGGVGASSYSHFSQVSIPPTITQQKQPESQQIGDSMDQGAMERAFEAVSLEQSESLNAIPTPVDMAMDFEEMYPFEEIRIGSDRILDESTREEGETNDKKDADELARTAGRLLDNVKHDQSEKFQQSSFLFLMRQLRNREVHVEGDKLVDSPQPLHPGGQFYPKSSP